MYSHIVLCIKTIDFCHYPVSQIHTHTHTHTGDPLAHLSLAHCYTHGKGVEESATKAFEHHLEASKSSQYQFILSIYEKHIYIVKILCRQSSGFIQRCHSLLCWQRCGTELQEGSRVL